MSVKSYEQKYNELMASLDMMHKRKVQKTRIALRSFVIIPTILLILVFMTDSSKSVFLVLWIASIFIIAGVLIVTEYQDYTLRKMVQSVEESPEEETLTEEIPEITDSETAVEINDDEAAEETEEVKAVEDETISQEAPVCSCETEAEPISCTKESEEAKAEDVCDTPAFTYDTPDESAARTEAEVGADS